MSAGAAPHALPCHLPRVSPTRSSANVPLRATLSHALGNKSTDEKAVDDDDDDEDVGRLVKENWKWAKMCSGDKV